MKKDSEISRMFVYAGNRHWLTILGMILAGLTEDFLAHQLPDLTGAVVMPIAVFILIFVFDWRLGLCCLVPLAVSVFCMKQMMGGDNAHFMEGYMKAFETMNKEAVEYIRG